MEVTAPAPSHAEEVKRRILEGAARAFSAAGFQGTSVPDIATEAGVSVGLLYRYFPSKADLFTACCLSEMEAEMAALTQRLAGIANPSERLRQGVEFYLQQMQAKRGAGVILGAMAEAPLSQDVRQVLQIRADTIQGFVRGYLDEGIRSGELDPATPVADFTLAISMMLDGVVCAWAVAGTDLDLDRVRDAAVSLLGAALRPRAPLPG
ncbi:MAG: TetR/AcrR family transcriptional regulator [Candidatus Dormibacteria bacterium]